MLSHHNTAYLNRRHHHYQSDLEYMQLLPEGSKKYDTPQLRRGHVKGPITKMTIKNIYLQGFCRHDNIFPQ